MIIAPRKPKIQYLRKCEYYVPVGPVDHNGETMGNNKYHPYNDSDVETEY